MRSSQFRPTCRVVGGHHLNACFMPFVVSFETGKSLSRGTDNGSCAAFRIFPVFPGRHRLKDSPHLAQTRTRADTPKTSGTTSGSCAGMLLIGIAAPSVRTYPTLRLPFIRLVLRRTAGKAALFAHFTSRRGWQDFDYTA